MRGVADEKQARPVPLLETVHHHGQQFDVIPALEFMHATGKEWRYLRDILPERRQPAALRLYERSLLDDKSALVVFNPIDRDEDAARDDVAECLLRIAGFLREPHPYGIDRGADLRSDESPPDLQW